MKGKTKADDVPCRDSREDEDPRLVHEGAARLLQANVHRRSRSYRRCRCLGPIDLLKLEFATRRSEAQLRCRAVDVPTARVSSSCRPKPRPKGVRPGSPNARLHEEEGSRPDCRAAAQDQPGAQALQRPAETDSGQDQHVDIKPRWEWRTFGTRFARAEAMLADWKRRACRRPTRCTCSPRRAATSRSAPACSMSRCFRR